MLSEGRDGRRPWQPRVDRVQRIEVSKLLRSVDLMVGGCLLSGGNGPRRPMIGRAMAVARTWADAVAIRREVVARAIDGLPTARLGATHLHVHGHAIHLRSRLVTRDGK